MLHSNARQTGASAHLAHAAVVGLHSICCGVPALAMVLAALSGTASGAILVSGAFARFHAALHAHEVWILVASASLVAIGGGLEVRARWRRPGQAFPWLFAFSGLCFFINLAIIVLHRSL
jgi:hypothetical protein